MMQPGIRIALALWVGLAFGCTTGPGESAESKEAFAERMREIEKRIKDAMPKTQEIALKQEVDAETLTKTQRQLNILKEYLNDPTGKMDFVTVNAIQSFQRQVGLEDDGLLDERTLELLAQESAKVEKGEMEYFGKGYYDGQSG